MATKPGLAPLSCDADYRAYLMAPTKGRVGYTREDMLWLATAAHQGLAIAHCVGHLLKLLEARDALPAGEWRRAFPADPTEQLGAVDAVVGIVSGACVDANEIRSSIDASVEPALKKLNAIGITMRDLPLFRSGPVMAAACARLYAGGKGIPLPNGMDMEVLIRITEDREPKESQDLEHGLGRSRARDAWKKHIRKTGRVMKILKEVPKERIR